MATRSWIREFIARRVADVTDEPVPVLVRMLDGELDGRVFEAALWSHNLPEKIYAGDLVPYAVGSYIRDRDVKGDEVWYRCRIDDDYVRMRGNKVRGEIERARRQLTHNLISKPRQ